SQVDLLDVTHTALVAQVQSVLSGLIGEVRNPLPIGRPRGIALHYARCSGQVARIAFLGGNGQDLTASFKDGSCAGRRQARIADARAHSLIPGAQCDEIRGDANLDLVRLVRLQVVQRDCAELLVGDDVRPRGSRLDIQAVVSDEL